MSNKTIHELSSLTEVAELDELPIYDVSATEAPTKKVTVGKIKEAVKGSYSTTEQLTGEKWIDGKPIYRIVLVQNGQITTNTAYFATEIANLNIDTITFKFAKAKVIAGGTVIRKNMTEYYANASDYFSVSASELSAITLFSGNPLSDLEVTIEYTKTTD